METKGLIKGLDGLSRINKVLVCFPFAGGGASAYKGWKRKLNDVIVCPIQLPGREEQIMMPPYKDMGQLVKDIVNEIYSRFDGRIYLLGHSMGSKIAYEVAKELEKRKKTVEMLIVSGSRVPHIPEANQIYHLPDDKFIASLRRFEGIPEKIFNNMELLSLFLPMLRADFEMDEMYYIKDIVSLSCPILALGGSMDAEATEEEICLWEKYTKNRFEYRIFEGGHFFIKQKEREVIEFVRKRIGDKRFRN